MVNKKILFILLLVSVLIGKNNETNYTPKKVAELKTLPTDGAETVEMVVKGKLLKISSSLTDTLGRVWYMVKIVGTNNGGFLLANDIEPVADEIDTANTPRLSKTVTADKKRRIECVRSHPDWSRRIKSAILAGTICLGMDREQLLVSWGNADIETDGFIVGAGEVRILFYRKGDPVAVVLKNNGVIGWSEKKRD